MEIKITESQYASLAKLVYLGMWMAEINEDDAGEFSEIEQLVYSWSQQIPGQKMIEFDSVDQKYYPSEQFDETDSIANTIENYEDSCFWDELIDRMTKKEMINIYGLDKIHQMNQDEIFQKEKVIIEKYEKVFQESGLEKLTLESK